MTTVFRNILTPLGLAPTATTRGRRGRGFSVSKSKTKGKVILQITDLDIVKAMGKKNVAFVGTYDNATLATNAGTALINRKAEILLQAAA